MYRTAVPDASPSPPSSGAFKATGCAVLVGQLLVLIGLICISCLYFDNTLPCGWQRLTPWIVGAACLPSLGMVIASAGRMWRGEGYASATIFLILNVPIFIGGMWGVIGPDPPPARPQDGTHTDMGLCRRAAYGYARWLPRCNAGDVHACDAMRRWNADPWAFSGGVSARYLEAMERGCGLGSAACCHEFGFLGPDTEKPRKRAAHVRACELDVHECGYLASDLANGWTGPRDCAAARTALARCRTEGDCQSGDQDMGACSIPTQ